MKKFLMRFDILSIAYMLAALLTIGGTIYIIKSDINKMITDNPGHISETRR